MSKLRIVSSSLVMAAALLTTAHRASAAVVSPVEGGLFVGLDGSSVLLYPDTNRVKVWYDQIGTTDEQYQDYGRQTTVVADRPTLLNVEMPNGTSRNVVDFNSSEKSYLESKLGTSSRITDTSQTFNPGADIAYNTQTLTWFLVYRQTGTASDARAVWRGNHDGTTNNADYGSFIEQEANDFVLTAHGRHSSDGIRRVDIPNEDGHRHDWYIVAASVDAVNGVVTFKALREDGTPFTPDDRTAPITAFGNHVLSRIGGSTAANTSGALDGQIAELLVYNRLLGAQETNDVMAYLNTKYLVPEPSSFVLAGMAIFGMGCVYRHKRRK